MLDENKETQLESVRRRLVVLTAWLFCLYAVLGVKLLEVVGAHRPAKISPSTQHIMFAAALVSVPFFVLGLSGLLKTATNRAAKTIGKQDYKREISIAILMLRERIKESLPGKSMLFLVPFFATMLWLIGIADTRVLFVGMFAAVCLVVSVLDDILLSNRIKNGNFAESESDARDLLRFIRTAKKSDFDDFVDRKLIRDDPGSGLGMSGLTDLGLSKQ